MAKLDKDDLQAIKELMDQTLQEGIEKYDLVTKEDISHLPTKEEFYKSQSELMGELQTMRDQEDNY